VPARESAGFGSGGIGSTLRDENDFERHCDYIHFNPVKHGHAIRPRDWPYSSFHRWVRLGGYPSDWADDPGDETIGWGER
jgi:putative transposase